MFLTLLHFHATVYLNNSLLEVLVKKVFWSAIALGIATIWFLPDAITVPFFHLIILGIIPGTNIEMGLIFPLVLITFATFLLVRWSSQAVDELVEFKTELARQEEAEAENQAVLHTGATADQAMDEEIEVISI